MIKNSLQTLKIDVQYVTDEQGNQLFVQIPFAQWQMISLKLKEGALIEETAESPELVDKQGVLVVRAQPFGDLSDISRDERNRRVSELLRRTGI
jgi:hypothetical protein